MTNQEQRRQEWAIRIADYRASGLAMAAWCSANERSMDQLKYWIRKLKNVPVTEAVSTQVRWTPLSTTDAPANNSSPTLIVHVGSSRIELQPGFDPSLLRSVVKALQLLC
jgi:hypothetical protein